MLYQSWLKLLANPGDCCGLGASQRSITANGKGTAAGEMHLIEIISEQRRRREELMANCAGNYPAW